jgi:hypothetical protein
MSELPSEARKARYPAQLRSRCSVCAIGLAAIVLGCAAGETSAPGDATDSSGAPSTGGSSPTTSGGAATTVGAGTGNATSSVGGTAGAVASGGAANHAGASGGGPPSSGGNAGGTQTSGTGGKCNSAGPNGEVFYDDFEDGEFATCPEWIDADPTLGGMWSVIDDGGSKVFAQTAPISDWVIAVSGSDALTDQVVQAKVKFSSKPGTIGIFARFQDVQNYYFLYLDGSNIVLRGRVNNSQLTSVKVKSPTVEGTWYTLKLSVIGSMLTGYLDGTLLVTTTNASVKSGGVGVGTSDEATGEFDDVTVTTQ